MVSSKVTTGSAMLIAYTLYCFSMQPTTSATPNLRGGVPSLYMKPTALASPGLRGASAVEASPTLSQTVAPREAYAIFEVMAVLIAMVTVAQCVPTWRPPTRITIIGCAILIAYAMFSLCIQSSMNVTPRLRGGIPSLYVQPVLITTHGLRGVVTEVARHEMPRVDQDETSFGPNACLEVVGVLVAVMALAQRVPACRSPSRMTTTVSAFLIAYALFSLGAPPSMSLTPRLRGGTPSFYMQPALRTTSSLRGIVTDGASNEMQTPDLAEAAYESYESFTDLADIIVQNLSPIAYWGALSVPAMAMAHFTQRKVHSKLN